MIKIKVNKGEAIQVESLGSEKAVINGKERNFQIHHTSKSTFNLIIEGQVHNFRVESDPEQEKIFQVFEKGIKHEVQVLESIDEVLSKMGMGAGSSGGVQEIKAPMPGSILEVLVKDGDEVSKGDKVLVLEAMKMENVIKSPIDGKIESVRIAVGDKVEKNSSLIKFEAA